MPNSPETSPAPALERGLWILEILQAQGAMSFEELATAVRIPKSSLLRLLDTLENRGYLERKNGGKTIIPLTALMPLAPREQSRQKVIQEHLESLSSQWGFTAEWYSPRPQYALLTQRSECSQGAVQILARIGYQRNWWGELDAVALAGHAALKLQGNAGQEKKCWQYAQGKQKACTPSARKKLINAVDLSAPLLDREYNSNGIRRMAMALCAPDESLLGILAVPMHFQPDADARIAERMQLLQQHSQLLQNILQESL